MKHVKYAFFALLLVFIPHSYTVGAADIRMAAPLDDPVPITASNLPIAGHLTAAMVYERLPKLKRVAACESTGNVNAAPRQFNTDGSILWGKEKDPTTGRTVTVKRDVGEAQINLWVWGAKAQSMGLDLKGSEDDNVYFMYWLYVQQGLSPWNSSRGCWASY